jgi:TP901 family phage tail tape measure protein
MSAIAEIYTLLGFKVDPKGTEKYEAQMQTVAKRASAVGQNIGRALSNPFALFAGAGIFGMAAHTAGDFEEKLLLVQAHSRATADELKALREQALGFGRDTEFSALQVAAAQERLAEAGFSPTSIRAMIPALIDFADASRQATEVATAQIVETAKAYGVSEAGYLHLTDMLTKGAQLARIPIAEITGELSNIAPVAKALGLTVEQSLGLYGGLRSKGIQGRLLSATLRSGLMGLQNPNDAFHRITGYKFFSPSSRADIFKLVGELSKMKLTMQQLEEIAGPGFGVGLKAIMDIGPEGMRKYAEEIANSTGETKRLAEAADKGLNYQLARLKNNLEALAITGGDTGIFANLTTMIINIVSFADKLSRANPELVQYVAYLGLLNLTLRAIGLSLYSLAKNPYGFLLLGVAAMGSQVYGHMKTMAEEGRSWRGEQKYEAWHPPMAMGARIPTNISVNVNVAGNATYENANHIAAVAADSLDQALRQARNSTLNTAPDSTRSP